MTKELDRLFECWSEGHSFDDFYIDVSNALRDNAAELQRLRAAVAMGLGTTPQAQPAREWVGLTEEELDKLAVDAGIITWVRYDNIDRKFYDLPLGEGRCMTGDVVYLKQFARLVEEALRKKNS